MQVFRSPILVASVVLFAGLGTRLCTAQQNEQIDVDAHAATTPFPHFWEEMFGSFHTSKYHCATSSIP